MATTVRRATIDDIDDIVAFQNALARETEDRDLDRAALSRGVSSVLCEHVPGHYLVAERGGRAVGCLMINPEWSDWTGTYMLWVNSVYVAPEARRTGVLRTLMGAVAATANPATIPKIKLYVETANAPAIAAYTRLGLEEQRYRLFEMAVARKA